MKLYSKISHLFARRWGRPGRRLSLVLGLGLAAALAVAVEVIDDIPYPLTVSKAAYNDAGSGGTVSGAVVTDLAAGQDFGDGITTPLSNRIVTYAISYGPGATTDPSTLGGLTFEDSMSTHMTMLGSPQVPTSWASTTSANATVSYTSPLMMAGSTSSRSPSAPAIMATGNGLGDGWVPIIYNSPDGKIKRFYEIFHHQWTGHINCQNFTDGKPCWSGPKELNYVSGKDRRGNDIVTGLGTPMLEHTVISGTRIYYPATNPNNSIGIGCWDASTDTSCGYIKLADHLAGSAWLGGPATYGNFVGVMQLPGKPDQLYMAEWGYLYCWDLGTNASCSKDYPYRYLTPSGHFDVTKQAHVDLLVAGTDTAPTMFAFTNGWVSCMNFDSSGKPSACAGGWPFKIGNVPDGNDRNALLHYLDKDGHVIGACANFDKGWGTRDSTIACYDRQGVARTPPKVLTDNRGNYYLASTSAVNGTKVYYALTVGIYGPDGADGSQGATACWDFSTDAACAKFTDAGGGTSTSAPQTGLRRWNYANAGSSSSGKIGRTVDYGYSFDGKCGYGLGDVAALWSFDPETGAAPCNATSDDVTVPDPKAFCDGLDHRSNWDRVQLKNAPAAIASVKVQVYDAATCPAPTPTTSTACTLLAVGEDIASKKPNTSLWEIKLVPTGSPVSLKAHPSIRVTYDYSFVDNKPPTSYPGFSATTIYTPDATTGAIGQVCMRAQVNNCPASVIDNLAIIKRADTGHVQGRARSTIYTNMANPPYSDTAPAVSNAVSLSGRVVFRTTYQTTDWSGDLTAYSTDSAGRPADVLWSTAPGTSSSAGAAKMLPAAAQRNILTTNGAGKAISFDATSLQANLSAAVLANFGGGPTEQTRVINFLRGDRSLESGQGANNPFRRRMLWDTSGTVTALGDFIHSAPVYDNGVVYAQANDGMLHAFLAETGVETFAFVPSAVFPLLKPLSDVSYKHNWIMDGQVAVAHSSKGGATLIGSTGGVNPALFGIDVSGLPKLAPDATKVLFETTHAALGRANGAIQIVTLPDGSVVGLLGNGMGSAANQAQLIQVNVSSGAITAINTNTGGADTPNGLSAPTPLVVGGQLLAVYAGDALGNLWRFPVSSSGIGTPVKLFTTGTNQPISAAPTVTAKMTLNGKAGYYVYFGTGKPVDRTDTTYLTQVESTVEQAGQALYGLYDQANSTGIPSSSGISSGTLVQQVMGPDDKVSNNPVNLSSMNGWYLNLASGDIGKKLGAERILGAVDYNPSTNAITVVTAWPQSSGCYNANLAGSHLINISATTGGTPPTSTIVGAEKVNQIVIMGTMAGVTRAAGLPGYGNILTSDAGGNPGTEVTLPDSKTADGISKVDIQGKALNLKRTSWVQLY